MDSGSRSMPWPLLSSKKSKPVMSPVSVHVTGEQDRQQQNSPRQSGGKTYINVLLSMFSDNIETNKNNDIFHTMFNTIPTDELLIGKFECALHRGDALTRLKGNNVSELAVTSSADSKTNNTICPYIGTLYVSKDHLCFNTKSFQHGWLSTRLQVSLSQILNIILYEQTVAANSETFENVYNGKYIIIETNLGKIQLNGFTTVEHVFNLIHTLWQNKKQNIDNNIIMMPSLYNLIRDSNRVHDDVEIMANDMRIEDLINSIDSSDSDLSSEEEESIDENDENDDNDEINIPVYKFKEDIPLKYKFKGPYYNETVNYSYTPPELNDNEILLKEEEFENISPGLLFELMFSGHELSFQAALLDAEESTQVSNYGPYIEGHRHYSYVKKLGYSIGPKSTKCEVEQTIMKYENDCIEWVSTTKTPNVPNGNLFQVRNRFLFYWNGGFKATGCNMRISYWIEWSGKSWLKSMIEKTCKQGIMEAQLRFDSFLQDYIKKYLTLGSVKASDTNEVKDEIVENTKSIAPVVVNEQVVTINEKAPDTTKTIKSTREYRVIDIAVGSLLLINLFVLLIILKNVRNNNSNNDKFEGLQQKYGSGKSPNSLVEMLIN